MLTWHKMKLLSHDGWRLPSHRYTEEPTFSRNTYTLTRRASRAAAHGCSAHEGPRYSMTHGCIPLKRKKMKSYVKYGLHCTNFHKTHKCSAVLCGFPLYRNSQKSVNKHGKYGYKIIYALSKVRPPLSRYLRKHACSTTFCRVLLYWIMKIRQTVLGHRHVERQMQRSPHKWRFDFLLRKDRPIITGTIPIILATHWIRLPDDGSYVNRNTSEQILYF
jgi:hypothetical protein